MAGSGNNESTWTLNLDGNAAASAKAAADAMEHLRKQIVGSQASIKGMSAQLKSLAGDSDEVKTAKAALEKQIKAEQAALSKTTLVQIKAGEQHKRGLALSKQLAERKKLALAQEEHESKLRAKNTAAISKAGGPVAALSSKFASLREALSTSGGRAALLTVGIVGMTAAFVAVTAAIVGAGAALGAWILKSADANRSARILREAAMGANAQWGKNAGEQIDALALKVPTAKAKLDEMGRALAKQNIGGQTWVDTMNAVAQASAALGDDAGSKIQEFITRGRQLGRMQINPLELIGTGVDFKDVANQLAVSMKVSVKEAQAALFEGRVKLADGAAALRGAVEKKFSGINLRQMMSLENLSKKLGEAFDALTKDVDIEPILRGLHEMADIFSLSTASGQALKQIVEVFGKELGASFTGTTPIAKKFIYGLIIGAQQLVIGYLQVRNTLRKTFGDSKILGDVDKLKIALEAGKLAMTGIAVSAIVVAGVFAALAAPFLGVVLAIQKVNDGIASLQDAFRKGGWDGVGLAIADGITNGLKAGGKRLIEAAKGLAKDTLKGVKETLDINSPSGAFEREVGKQIPAGQAKGIEDNAHLAQDAADNMVTPRGGASGGRAGGAITVNIPVTINVGGDGKAAASELKAATDSILEQVTKAVIDAIQTAGLPVPG